MRRRMIAGNWKMNGLRAQARDLAQGVRAEAERLGRDCDVLICPPFVHLADVAGLLGDGPVALGAQDCHSAAKGAHTGEIAAPMLQDLGCSYVIVGHSERRQDHGEDDARVAQKAAAVLAAGMQPVICVGETEAERDKGRTLEVIERQLLGSLPQEGVTGAVVIAYEPVWAIGTGRVPTSTDVAEVHAHIRARLTDRLGAETANAMRILYGGSMKPENAGELLGIANVDGGLIGGASLKAQDFAQIIAACPKA